MPPKDTTEEKVLGINETIEDINLATGEENIKLTPLSTGPTVLSSENGRETMDKIEEAVTVEPEDDVPEPTPTAEETLLQTEIDAEKDAETLRTEEEIKAAELFFKQQAVTVGRNRARQLRSISQQFNRFASRIGKSTRRRVKLQETIGARFGGRFTIEHTADLVKEQVDIGIQALEDLAGRESAAKGKIEDAFDEKERVLALQEFNLLNEILAEKEKKFDEIEKLLREALKTQQEEEKKLANQELIAEQLETGLTNAVDIFSALAGEVPFDDILAITKELDIEKATDLKFISGTKTQEAGIFDPNTGIFTSLKKTGNIGLGGGPVGPSGLKFPTNADLETMTNEERDFVTKVVRGLPTKLKDAIQEKKDRMKEALFDFRRGRSLQSVVDEIKGFIIQDDKDMPFGLVLRRLATGTDIELGEISAAINNGDKVKAMTIVENANLEKAEGELSEVVSAQAIIKNANRVLKLLETAPVNKLGAFDGRKFKVLKFAGLTTAEVVKTQQLETALVNLLNEIRRKSLGTAVTESEVAFLEPLLADVLDQPIIIKTKMEELKVGTVNNHNRARNLTGIPEVTEFQLLDNDLRLKLYESLAEELSADAFNGVSNADLFDSILKGGDDTEVSLSGDNKDFFNQF